MFNIFIKLFNYYFYYISIYMIEIIKPKLDLREFHGGKLDNGIKYVLINDKYLETSYVSISVNIGSFADTINGLAHFLEHMLFMGSHKYPDIDYYFNRLKELGGSSNAYTSDFNTVYYFNVFNDGLDEIFEIFSRFFIDPLFKKESIDKEMNAVNNEHLKNINNDSWKIEYFTNYITNAKSSINKFGTGSLETLNKSNIRELLIDFYNKYYISENISICIGSSINKDKLYKIIHNTFGGIKNKKKNEYKIKKPFYNENLLKTYHLQSLSKIYKLIYIWEIPSLTDGFLYSKDFEILEYILLNNSENSLSFHFHNLGYIINLYVDILYEGKFIIYILLTEKGFNNTEYIDSILFSYLSYIYTLDLTEYSKYIKNVYDFNFDYNKIDTNNTLCNRLCTSHFNIKTKELLKNISCISILKNNYNDLFKKYINVNNFIKILISDKKFKNYKYNELNFYKDTFYTELNSITNVKLITNKILKLDITNNIYLDSKTKLIDKLDKFTIPILIKRREWYGACSKFNEPIIYICFQINNNNYFNTCYNSILTNISCTIINYILSIKFYKEYELSYDISLSTNFILSSIFINIKSLNDMDKLKLLINNLYHFIINISKYVNKISNDFIENLLITLKNDYNNIKFINPYEYSTYLINNNVLPNSYSTNDYLLNLKKINFNIIKNYINNLFNKSSLTIITYGNTYIIDDLFTKFNKLFTNNPYPYYINNRLNNIIFKHPNKKETSICVNYLFYIGNFTPKLFLLMNIVISILSQEFFNILRTKKQLGYLVRMAINNYNNDYYIIQTVQSNKSVDTVKKEINKFNNKIINIIKKANLLNYINQIKKDLSEPDNSLYDKYNKYISEIILRKYLFYKNEILLDNIDSLNINDLLNFIKLYINKKNRIQVIIK